MNVKEFDNINYPKVLWIIQIMAGVILFPMVLVFRDDIFKFWVSISALIYSVLNVGVKGYVFFQQLRCYKENRRR
jgi:hypothetical protein